MGRAATIDTQVPRSPEPVPTRHTRRRPRRPPPPPRLLARGVPRAKVTSAGVFFSVTRKRCRNYPPPRSNLVGIAEALPDLHRHVPVFAMKPSSPEPKVLQTTISTILA